MVELTFKKVDPDTGNLLYKGTDGKMYASLQGTIYDMTDAGEPDTPVHDVKIKVGEPEYDPKDRFGRKLEKTNEGMKMKNLKTFESFNHPINEAKNEKQLLADLKKYLDKEGIKYEEFKKNHGFGDELGVSLLDKWSIACNYDDTRPYILHEETSPHNIDLISTNKNPEEAYQSYLFYKKRP